MVCETVVETLFISDEVVSMLRASRQNSAVLGLEDEGDIWTRQDPYQQMLQRDSLTVPPKPDDKVIDVTICHDAIAKSTPKTYSPHENRAVDNKKV